MMAKALHTKSIWKSNLMTDIRLASEAGFGAMEVAAETSRLLDKYVLIALRIKIVIIPTNRDTITVERSRT